MAAGDEVPGVQASSLTRKSKQTSANRIFFMDKGTLDKNDRMTGFFGWSRAASEARFHGDLQSILRAAALGSLPH